MRLFFNCNVYLCSYLWCLMITLGSPPLPSTTATEPALLYLAASGALADARTQTLRRPGAARRGNAAGARRQGKLAACMSNLTNCVQGCKRELFQPHKA